MYSCYRFYLSVDWCCIVCVDSYFFYYYFWLINIIDNIVCRMPSFDINKNLIRLQSNLKNFALSLTYNEMDAEDLLQDTTLKVLNNKDKFVDNVNFKGWVFTVMRNIFINNYHKVVKSQSVIDNSVDLSNVNLVNDGGEFTPQGAMDIKDIRKAINSLSPILKESLGLYVKGYKYNEISEMLDIPIGTVKSRIFLARKELQKYLNDFL